MNDLNFVTGEKLDQLAALHRIKRGTNEPDSNLRRRIQEIRANPDLSWPAKIDAIDVVKAIEIDGRRTDLARVQAARFFKVRYEDVTDQQHRVFINVPWDHVPFFTDSNRYR